MRSKVDHTHSEEAEKTVRDIRRATRRQYAAEEKVRIVIAGLRGEYAILQMEKRLVPTRGIGGRCAYTPHNKSLARRLGKSPRAREILLGCIRLSLCGVYVYICFVIDRGSNDARCGETVERLRTAEKRHLERSRRGGVPKFYAGMTGEK